MGNDKSDSRTSQRTKYLRPLSFAKVVLETSVPHLDREYDYAIPEHLSKEIQIGSRVQVPFGRQKLNGWIVEKFSQSAYESKIAEIIKPIGLLTTLKPNILQLAQITAQYFIGTVSDVLRFAVPPRSAAVEKKYEIKKLDVSETEAQLPRNYAQPKLYLLKTTESWHEAVWQKINQVHLENRKALLVVPEHDQINQFLEFIRSKDSAKDFAILSAESHPADRYKNFLDIYFGNINLVIGTRNAIFAPITGQFDIFILNEYSDIYQSPQAPYWQVPKVAQWRAIRENCELTFIGYSMSVTRFKELQDGNYDLLENKATASRVSKIQKDAKSKIGKTDDYSASLWQALSESKYGPVLVQVPRKGLANLLMCEKCSRVLSCRSCSGALRLIDSSSVPKCLRCASLQGEISCRFCSNNSYRVLQSGQSGVLKTLGSRFPGVKIHSSTSEKRVFRIDESPSITVCTPGAAPKAVAGYRAIVVLNATAQFSNPKLEVVSEVFNQWIELLSQLKNHPEAHFIINGDIDDTFFNQIKSQKILDFLQIEYDQRKMAKLPPAMSSVVLRGNTKQLALAVEKIQQNEEITVLGPVVFPLKEDLFQVAILGREIQQLIFFAKNAVALASLKGKESLQVKVESMDFI